MPTFLQKLTGIKENEASAVLWSMLYVICLFLAYYVLRPIRDEMGIAGGVDNLPWLFTGTLIVMLLISPLFALSVRSMPRRQFIALSYHFFSVNLIIFAILLRYADATWQVWVSRAFFIWVSVFNLFVVSIFWSFIVDVFDSEQGKRLFGLLSAGATLGSLMGSALTALLVRNIDPSWLLFLAVFFLELAVVMSRRLSFIAVTWVPSERHQDDNKPVGGGVFTGLLHTLRSPYLAGIAVFILLYSVTSTLLYFQQANIVQASFQEREARTAFFASIDLLVNSIALFFQIFITSRLITGLGIVFTICILPLISMVGFAALAFAPSTLMLFIVQVTRRAANFAIAKPVREVLFTSSHREDRYKAKNFIDTVVYRCGDQIASFSYAGLISIGLVSGQMAVIAISLSGLWLMLSFWLGKAHLRMVSGDDSESLADKHC